MSFASGSSTPPVAAGSFEIWHRCVSSDCFSLEAWHSTGESCILIKYDNGPQRFELVSMK